MKRLDSRLRGNDENGRSFELAGKVVRRCGGLLLSVAALGLTATLLVPRLCARGGAIPSPADVRASWRSSDAALLDRHGRVVHEMRLDEQRRSLAWTPLDDVSPALCTAIVASEDRRFFVHRGVDGIALLGVAARALAGQAPRGASTITMQVATMLDPALQRNGGPRTIWQKWRQMRWAWALERRWSKAEIVEAYLNLITFRGELQGIAAASRVLLGKTPDGVTDGEALVLAALVRAPNAAAEPVIRRAQLLRAATRVAVADGEIRDVAAQLTHGGSPHHAAMALAPHLAQRLLVGDATARTVHSTVDAEVQQAATQALRSQLLALGDKHVRDGAVLVADNATGDVLGYVGGSGDLSSGRYVDAIRAHRQAGSTLKPFLYALAFDRRLLTPASLIDDRPLDVPVFGGLYRPENYDQQFRGAVSVRTALAGSLNIPAVRALAVVGADSFVDQLRRLGFVALNEPGEYYGPALALGAADVSLEELVNAYRVLANGGKFSPLRFRPVARELAVEPTRVYSESAAFLIASILADRDSRSVTFGLESPLATRFWSAVKTGTSKSMRDNWCVGYSHRFTVGVWVGNLSGQPMRGVSGMSGAAPIWVEVMEWLQRNADSQPPAVPADVVAARVAVAEVEPERSEWFIAGTEPPEPRIQPARGRARITAPVAGTVIALDPDIPTARQRVALRAEMHEVSGRWQLDGIDLGPGVETALWAPRPGTHRLVLVTADGVELDAVTFAVRGHLTAAAPRS